MKVSTTRSGLLVLYIDAWSVDVPQNTHHVVVVSGLKLSLHASRVAILWLLSTATFTCDAANLITNHVEMVPHGMHSQPARRDPPPLVDLAAVLEAYVIHSHQSNLRTICAARIRLCPSQTSVAIKDRCHAAMRKTLRRWPS